jgi:nitrogen PTS system EIIA component
MAGFGDPLMTLSELADYLQVAEKTIMRMISRGEIPAIKIGSQWRFSRSMVDDWILSNMQVLPRNDLARLIIDSDDLVPLSRLVQADSVLLDMKPGSKREILEQLVRPLVEKQQIHDAKSYLEILLAREAMMTTAIGPVAFPHARNPRENEAAEPRIIAGICRDGTDYGSLDGSLTYLFLLPFTDSEIIHLKLMAKMAHLFKEPGNVEKVLSAKSAEHVVGVLISMEQKGAQKWN